MQLSDFGHTIGGPTGIMELMDDMGKAVTGDEPMIMLGGGNPAHIPEVNALWRRQLERMLQEEGAIERMLATYDTPRGQPVFIRALADLLNREFGWTVRPENVAVTNGSQTAFFLLINMLTGNYGRAGGRSDGGTRPDRTSSGRPSRGEASGGKTPDEERRPGAILFPLMPEYIGYADQALSPGSFVACRPRIETITDHIHKYRIDFREVEKRLALHNTEGTPARDRDDPYGTSPVPRITAICVSRPTNPSGNVLTDDEIASLDALARRYGIPLIVDNAYGTPFPHIIFDDLLQGSARPVWNDNIVLGMSLSKIGLPGARTGIIIAREEIVHSLSRANAVLSLANTTVGQCLVEPLLRDGSMLRIARETIMPHYRNRADRAHQVLHEVFPAGIPWSVHRTEGSIFLWLSLPGLAVSSLELYQRLKKRGVLVVPGEYFFFGDSQITTWRHARECLRINYGGDPDQLARGLQIIAEEAVAARAR